MSSVSALPFAAWPVGRKVAAGVFAGLGYVALAGLAVYLAGVLFLVLNKANPRQAQWTSIVHYWQLYADDAGLRKKLQAAIAISGLGMLVVLPGALFAAARPRRALHGDARFANPAEVSRAGLLGRAKASGPSILIGRYRGRYLALPGQLSVMLSAPTRSGKGVGVVIPNLLNWPDSVVVLDIKGENFAITAGFRAQHGHAVYAFSPFDEDARSHRWNPLSAVRSSPLHRVGDLLTVGQAFFPNDGSGTSSEAFFNDQARNLFLGLGLLLLETPALPRTLGELLRQSSGKGRSLKDHLTALIKQRQDEGHPYSDECADALQRLLSNSENTLTSIVATLNAPLVIFAGEFGRTPTAQGNNGRDHNPHGFTMWMAGGGVKGGYVHGATDEYGYYALENKMHIHDLHATILHLLGLDHERLTYRHAGRDFRLTDVAGRVATDIIA